MHHPSMLGFIATAWLGSALAVPFHDENGSSPGTSYHPHCPSNGWSLSHLSIQGGRSPSDYLIRDNYIVVFKEGRVLVNITPSFRRKFTSSGSETSNNVSNPTRMAQPTYSRVSGITLASSLCRALSEEKTPSTPSKLLFDHVPQALISIIRSFPEVDYVERDSRVWINGHYDNPSPPSPSPRALSMSTPSKILPGLGVDTYVIDTGVNIEHEDLEGRAI
ncbi:hypothetical protein Pst134EB_012116 [Puccinia striiformis f. sp. tritici]|nr:hypothetical protein Pst134EB_012116 [Puccinia striiformis f. sp. tritici]